MTATSASFHGPRYYDQQLAPVNFVPFARELAARIPVHPGGPVLEIACGTGVVTRALRERLDADVEIVATDLSPAMLAYAHEHLAQLARVTWHEADAQHLPFADASFAAVVCGFGFMFAQDRQAALNEARRVLQPEGQLRFTVWDRIEDNPHARVNAEVVEGLFPGDAQMKFRVPYEMSDEGGLSTLLAAAGFADVRIDTVRQEIQGVDPQVLASGQIRGTPRSALLEERGANLQDVIDAIARALIRQGGNPYRGYAQAKVVEATAA